MQSRKLAHVSVPVVRRRPRSSGQPRTNGALRSAGGQQNPQLPVTYTQAVASRGSPALLAARNPPMPSRATVPAGPRGPRSKESSFDHRSIKSCQAKRGQAAADMFPIKACSVEVALATVYERHHFANQMWSRHITLILLLSSRSPPPRWGSVFERLGPARYWPLDDSAG